MTLPQMLRRLLPLFLVVAGIPAQAEGPLVVGGPPQSAQFPGGIPNSVPGLPFHWPIDLNTLTATVTYWTDQGSLGTQTKAQADQLVANAFGVWQNAPTGAISFSKASDLTQDVSVLNVRDVLNAIGDCSTLPGPPAGGIAQPRSIIYDDSNGSITSFLGDDPNTTLGFAETVCLEADGTSNFFTRSYAVLNGKFTDTSQDQTDLLAVMIHEFGHMIGLDHSQINVECLAICSPDALKGVPTMFPVLVSGTEMSTLSTDDIAGVSVLYPGATFTTSTGRIQGHIVFSDGATPAEGYNVVIRQVGNPQAIAVSNVSGYLFTPDAGNPFVQLPGATPYPFGSHKAALIGSYDIPGLPPGDYTIGVEPIHNSGIIPFVLGSGVGPIGSDLGFQFPMPGECASEFWNSSESANDQCTDQTPWTVTAGSSTINMDIILNGTPPRYDAWEDGP